MTASSGADSLLALSSSHELAHTLAVRAGRSTQSDCTSQSATRSLGTLGPDDPDTLATLNGLGLAYRDAGRFSDAIHLFEQVRDSVHKHVGPDHPNYLTALNNLGLAFQGAGRLPEAIQVLRASSG